MTVVPFRQGELFGEVEELASEEALDASQIGRLAEFLVCAELTRLGYYVVHCDTRGFDILLSIEDRSLRVQVKSTAVVRDGYCIWRCQKHMVAGNAPDRNKRTLDRRDCDLVALFHHVFGTVIFLSIGEVPRGSRIDLPVAQVREVNSGKSLERALARLDG